MGFYLGINGILTFKNSGLQDVVNFTGLEKIVLETDSPFLAPVPHRGKRNESSYLLHIARKLAGILSISLNEVASTTTNNSKALFQINQD
jgi:TatD DNase family protein